MKNRTKIRVRYEETDAMGVVYHGNYLTWFEIGRTELLRTCALPYKDWEQKKFFLPVIEATCRYKKSAHYDEEIIIETELQQSTDLYFNFTYGIFRKSNDLVEGLQAEELLAEGETKHVCIGEKGQIMAKTTRLLKHQIFSAPADKGTF